MGAYKEIEKKGGGGKDFLQFGTLARELHSCLIFLFCKINGFTQWCFCVIMWLTGASNMKFKCQCLYSIGFKQAKLRIPLLFILW